MGRFAAGESPAMDRLVADAVAEIGADVSAAKAPRLAGVVLGGGYGRGEGGVFVRRDGSETLYNDLDFFAITESGAGDADIAAITVALEPVSRKWSGRLGIDVDFTVRTPWRIRHDQDRLMIQELLHGHVDVAGRGGAELFAGVKRLQPGELPAMEAARLLMNRGMGLMFARESSDPAFAARNVNKCVLGSGDAALIARGGYLWKASERAKALGDGLYSAALEWKFRPRAEAVCGWETARETWLAALERVNQSLPDASARSAYQAVRWIARRRSIGDPRTMGMDPVVRILRRLERVVRGRAAVGDSLRRDWNVFN